MVFLFYFGGKMNKKYFKELEQKIYSIFPFVKISETEYSTTCQTEFSLSFYYKGSFNEFHITVEDYLLDEDIMEPDCIESIYNDIYHKMKSYIVNIIEQEEKQCIK